MPSTTVPYPVLPDGRPVVPRTGMLRPLGIHEVQITGGFWAHRQELNRTAILSHIDQWLDREGWLGNFDAAARGTLPGARRGREFSDSEPYKYLEALAWELARRPDLARERRFHAIVARIAAAQEPDGYLNTMFGRPGQGERWSDLEWGHELYCLGHLMQAAVARVRTGYPEDTLVAVARRAADLVCAVFGPDGRQGICGHAEIEIGLAELGRALAEPRYVRQAALFVDRHGRGSLTPADSGPGYFQDDTTVQDANAFHGHAVRANYLAAGAVDVAVETANTALLAAVSQQFTRTQARRTYLTGGQGARHHDEAFGEDFQLPPDRAYSETCAAVASGMVAWRLLLASADAAYADAMERTLFNVVATSTSTDGRSFFYANTLHQRVVGEPCDPHVASARAASSLRAPWFSVSCCPPNVARTFASLAAYIATATATGVQLQHYAPARIATTVAAGPVELDVATDYPHQGSVRVNVVRAPDGFDLTLRVPAWSGRAVVRVGDHVHQTGPGTVTVGVNSGDIVELELDMTPQFVYADDRIDAVRGCVAVIRGPEVWCLESIDLPPGTDVADVSVDASVPPQFTAGVVRIRAWIAPTGREDQWPYTPYTPGVAKRTWNDPGHEVTLTRYHEWANRGPSTMRVWLPVG